MRVRLSHRSPLSNKKRLSGELKLRSMNESVNGLHLFTFSEENGTAIVHLHAQHGMLLQAGRLGLGSIGPRPKTTSKCSRDRFKFCKYGPGVGDNNFSTLESLTTHGG